MTYAAKNMTDITVTAIEDERQSGARSGSGSNGDNIFYRYGPLVLARRQVPRFGRLILP